MSRKLEKIAVLLSFGLFLVCTILVIYWGATTNIKFLLFESVTSGETIVPRFLAELFLFNFRGGKIDIAELKSEDGGLNIVIGLLSYSKLDNENKAKYIRFFISKGCGVNDVFASNGTRPLHAAVYSGKPELVELLLENGANPLLKTVRKDIKNMTPLELAYLEQKISDTDYRKVIEILRKAELNWNRKSPRVKPAGP